MNIEHQQYRVWREENSNTLYFRGRIRLHGQTDRQPLNDLLDDTIRSNSATMTWDFQELDFINGSGLDVIYRKVIRISRDCPSMNLLVRGCDSIPWQQSALPNIKKLMPAVRLKFEANAPILAPTNGAA
jgi:hypothetical protein